MIASIEVPTNEFSFKIQYNEKKCSKGEAYLLDNQTGGKNTEEYNKIFEETVALNNRVYQNKCVSFSLNLPPGEEISDDVFRRIVKDYLHEMGYNNNPYLAYKHLDQDHKHVHVVTSSVTWDGKKVSEFSNHRRSQKISRQLEVNYDLKRTEARPFQDSRNLDEVNAQKYKHYNGFLKGIKEKEILDLIKDKIGEEGVLKLKEVPLQYEDLKALFKDDKDFSQVVSVLEAKGLVFKSHKSVLSEKLMYFRSVSVSKEDFYKKLEHNKIYIRELADKNRTFIKYGMEIEGKDFYISDKKLPTSLRFEAVQLIGKDSKLFKTEEEQKTWLRRMVLREVARGISIEDLKSRLAVNKIALKEFTHKSGEIYGVSFYSENLLNPVVFKGSDLDRKYLSWNVIKDNLDINRHNFNKVEIKLSTDPPAAEKHIESTSSPGSDLKKIGREMGDESKDEYEREQERKRNRDLGL